jgi:hypothetical protein
MCLGHDSQFRSPSLTPGTFPDHLYRAISLQTLSQSCFFYERRPDAVIMEQGYPQQDCGEREGRANDQLPRLGLPTSKEEREKFKLAPPDGVQLF